MKSVTDPAIVATWVATSVLVGTTAAFLAVIAGPSDQLYDAIVDGNELATAAVVFVRWSFLTFVCVAPLAGAAVVLRTQFRRARARPRSAAKRRSGPVSGDE